MDDTSTEAAGYSDPDSRAAVERYRARFAQFARSPQTLGWRPQTQEVRFAAFVAGFSIVTPESVLDIGCGFGDLLAFLRARGWAGDYLGVDIVPEFISEAQTHFAADSRAEFQCLDFMENPGALIRDAAFASGLLNHKRGDAHEAYMQRFIGAVAKSSRRYAAIDFISDTSDRRRDDLFYHKPGDVLQIGLKHTKRAELDHSYMPYEFMLKLWFPDTVPPDFPVF